MAPGIGIHRCGGREGLERGFAPVYTRARAKSTRVFQSQATGPRLIFVQLLPGV